MDGFVGLTEGHQTGIRFPWGTPAHLFRPHWLPPHPSLELFQFCMPFSPFLWVLAQLSLYQRVLPSRCYRRRGSPPVYLHCSVFLRSPSVTQVNVCLPLPLEWKLLEGSLKQCLFHGKHLVNIDERKTGGTEGRMADQYLKIFPLGLVSLLPGA